MTLGLTTTARIDFETRQEIGQEGKNSTVFLAHDKQLDAELVIKKIEKSKLQSSKEFFSEAQRLYDSSHANVVQIKYACEDDDHIYLAMPFYARGSLKTLIDNRFLTVREIITFSIQFLSGLSHIHSKKLIHFDVKPDNILISDSGEALLSDFGLSKNMNDFGMSQQDTAYTRQVPPERYFQREQSSLYDIYMAGVTLYRLCNGNQLFYEQFNKLKMDLNQFKEAIRLGQFPDRTKYKPHIPKELQRVINKAIHPIAGSRYQTALEFVNALSKVNTLLDWQYNHVEEKWTLEEMEKTTEVSINKRAFFPSIFASKTMKKSGKTMKISDACKNNVPATDLNEEVHKTLCLLGI